MGPCGSTGAPGAEVLVRQGPRQPRDENLHHTRHTTAGPHANGLQQPPWRPLPTPRRARARIMADGPTPQRHLDGVDLLRSTTWARASRRDGPRTSGKCRVGLVLTRRPADPTTRRPTTVAYERRKPAGFTFAFTYAGATHSLPVYHRLPSRSPVTTTYDTTRHRYHDL